jgi:exopolyphosphatase/guanosine-5'-triphosphate,3'-diphosphate pyrophosphatase
MTQRFLNHGDLKNDLENKKQEIKSFLNSLNIEDLKDYSFVATAGTPTTIAAIKLGQDFFSYDRNIVNGTVVNLEDMANCLQILRNSSKEDITKLVGRGRVDFIEVGIYIYKMIFEVLGKNESIVLDDGLREGVAINCCITKCKD